MFQQVWLRLRWIRLKNPMRLCLAFFFFLGTHLRDKPNCYGYCSWTVAIMFDFSHPFQHISGSCVLFPCTPFNFFFFQAAFQWDFSSYSYCLWTVAATFNYSPVNSIHVHCSWVPQTSIFSQFFIKNGSYGTIYIFKNYFISVFSVFNFSKISSI